ncbi:TetR/AcrR family transcriptional regulator [Companilactobacillus huachuanensis]|uniref:TetR/AcrR family transcriptional regulator n=1 Tax=Companilactobacillus huachuanensis TaxID=2559914 RepID=A0ABW1RQD3_9LACO|nr:TetR/AcrR family transcriptional regulator [Companilactobacillus huachuanensis]
MAATNHSRQIKQDSQIYLITALLQILKNKNLNDITVTQVVKRAGVSRMAFYRNFETLNDVLIAYFKPKIDAEFNLIINKVPPEEKIAALGNFFAETSDTMELAVKRNYEFIIQNIFKENMLNFYDAVIDWSNFSAIQKKYWTRFMSAGVYAIWREWLIDGQTDSLNDIHVLLSDFQTSTLKALKAEENF